MWILNVGTHGESFRGTCRGKSFVHSFLEEWTRLRGVNQGIALILHLEPRLSKDFRAEADGRMTLLKVFREQFEAGHWQQDLVEHYRACPLENQ